MDIITILNLIGFTLDVAGKVIISYTVIAVHVRFRTEHKVDEAVFKTMKKEHKWAVLGIILMIIGYFLQLPSKVY